MSLPELVPTLFSGLFDDAALFPPGNAPMPDAAKGHAGYRQAWYAELVGLFVCPAARLAELAAAIEDAGAEPIDLAMTVPGGLEELAASIAHASSLAGLRLRAVELPLAGGSAPADAVSRLAACGVTAFAEVPVADLTPAVAGLLDGAGIGLKLRTGGSSPEAFPTPDALGRAITVAVRAGVRFKCTAGLHNAIAHRDPATGFAHHGFLNVLLAVRAALADEDPAGILGSTDPAMLAGQAGALAAGEVAALRGRFASIGSCSILEPLTDLQNLGVVALP